MKLQNPYVKAAAISATGLLFILALAGAFVGVAFGIDAIESW